MTSVIGPVQSHYHEGSRVGKRSLRWEGCWKGRFWAWSESEGVMDDESGDDKRDGLTSGWGGESRQEWWGWRNDSGSWFQRRNERSVIFKEMVGGRERVTADEERILQGGWTVIRLWRREIRSSDRNASRWFLPRCAKQRSCIARLLRSWSLMLSRSIWLAGCHVRALCRNG